MEEAIQLLKGPNFDTPSPVSVAYLIRLYQQLKQTKSTSSFVQKLNCITEFLKRKPCLINMFHYRWIAVRALLSECYFRDLEDSCAVAGVLTCLENLFMFVQTEFLLQTEIAFRGLMPPSGTAQGNDRSQQESSCFESYVLRHANASRLKLHGERFVSLLGLSQRERDPSYFASEMAKTKPNSVLRILQHGGRLSDSNRIFPSFIPDILVQVLHGIISLGAEEHLWDAQTLEFLAEPLNMTTEVKRMCVSFRTFLRDMPNPHEATFYLAGYRSRKIKIPDLRTILPFYDKIFPDCFYGRKQPSSLRHMCRHLIRKTLYDNWKLPDGIQTLPIPVVLRDYINLLYD